MDSPKLGGFPIEWELVATTLRNCAATPHVVGQGSSGLNDKCVPWIYGLSLTREEVSVGALPGGATECRQ